MLNWIIYAGCLLAVGCALAWRGVRKVLRF
jgi:hypothetical protein